MIFAVQKHKHTARFAAPNIGRHLGDRHRYATRTNANTADATHFFSRVGITRAAQWCFI